MMRRSRQMMVFPALAMIFLAPLLFAWIFYHTSMDPRRGLQHGELLLPLRPLIAPPLTAADGTPLGADTFTGHWTLLFRSMNHCDAQCRQLLATLQNVRLAQGRAMTQVQRVLVLTRPASGDEVRELSRGSGDLRVATAASWPLPPGWVYLLDPQGNLVFRYRPGFDPRGLLQDLQRLLRMTVTV